MRRVTLVTGGARRVGAAIIRSFAAAGDAIVLHYGASGAEAEALASELKGEGTPVHLVQADLMDPDAPQHIIDEAVGAFGRLDLLVNNASRMEVQRFESVTVDSWERSQTVNVRAPFFLSRAAASVMEEGASIIHMADHLGSETGFRALYSHQIAKSAVPQMVRILAVELAPRIRVNAVQPGLVLAPADMTESVKEAFLADVPLARSGTPADVVGAIHYLVNSPYVTGVVLPVDGGRTLRR